MGTAHLKILSAHTTKFIFTLHARIRMHRSYTVNSDRTLNNLIVKIHLKFDLHISETNSNSSVFNRGVNIETLLCFLNRYLKNLNNRLLLVIDVFLVGFRCDWQNIRPHKKINVISMRGREEQSSYCASLYPNIFKFTDSLPYSCTVYT